METSRGMGWIPDVPKFEDYSLQTPKVAALLKDTSLAPIAASQQTTTAKTAKAKGPPRLPAKVDLREWFSPVEHQGSLNSCTAHAAVALVEYFQIRSTGKYVDASRLFVYKTIRNLLEWTGDRGGLLRTAMEALVLFGAPPERYWPYDPQPASTNPRFDLEPPAFCYAFAANYQALRYFRLDSNATSPGQLLVKIKQSLAAGFPIMFGFPVYSEYQNPEGGLIPLPGPNTQYYNGHANVAAGYDDNLMVGGTKGALLVRNSWGTDWGDKGYGWMSYRYVLDALAYDWWTMVKAEWVDSGRFE